MSTDTPIPVPQPPSRRRWLFLFSLICLALAGTYMLVSRDPDANDGTKKTPPSPPVAVVTQAAKKSDISVYLTGIGTVTPLNTVTVRSRVDGQLMEVLYREGQTVSRGQLLARIDPRPFQVLLTQAEGQMARDQAQLSNARVDLQRYRTLWAQNSIPRQQLDTQEALVRQYQAAVKSDQGQVDSARLQLTYSRITAPCDGRVGLRLVDAGNIVHASDSGGLVVITRMQPMTVVFTIPEDNLPLLVDRMRGGRKLAVDAFDREQKRVLATGSLLTLDNQIDPGTGTVKLKAIFTNRDNELFPNQFVNARLLVDVRRDAITVPSAAIQNGPKGTFVYLVKGNRTVELRPVEKGESEGGKTAITRGLAIGEQVVVDGAERLREGSRVQIKQPGQASATPVRRDTNPAHGAP
ncbi:efflux transporter, RND family, MFP subunit [Pelobacter propionicus DSM 2379]|uniref:Efflux transporter, RND family, MFP subunit n=2 Tax=Pelobacter propionicus TaxID=29543 RepID=A1AR39_PELPD|nr:efflux transporter, RND family, MFP subunit [Pelobacter propionicus DSM 2379]